MNRRNKRLFNVGGCLTLEAISDFLKGTLAPHDIRKINQHLENCMVCSEALKGFRNQRRSGAMRSDIAFLSGKIRKRYMSHGRVNRLMPFMIIVSVLLSLILLLVVYYIIRNFLAAG